MLVTADLHVMYQGSQFQLKIFFTVSTDSQNTAPLRYGRPKFESRLEDLSWSHPIICFPTLLPVSSDLSYHNKGKNAKKKKKLFTVLLKKRSATSWSKITGRKEKKIDSLSIFVLFSKMHLLEYLRSKMRNKQTHICQWGKKNNLVFPLN